MIAVCLANGFELAEALVPADIMKRGGLDVVLAGVDGREVVSSNGVAVKADILVEELNMGGLDALVLPGGMPGTLNLESSEAVQNLIGWCVENRKLVAAICAAPSILAHRGLLTGREATAFPKFQKDLEEGGAVLSRHFVCQDGQFVTARGMGVSTQFGLKLVELLVSPEKAAEVKSAIQWEE